MIKSALLALLLLPDVAAASAHIVPDLSKVGRGAPIPSVVLDVVHANSLDALLDQAAPKIRAFTADTGMEACAAIAVSASGQWHASITTNYSHLACAAADPAPGFVAIGRTIHSHPHTDKVRLNRVDVLLMSIAARPGQVATIAPNGFSPRDIKNGPGYLVTRDALLTQGVEDHQHAR